MRTKACSCRVGVDLLKKITIDLIKQREIVHHPHKELYSHRKSKGSTMNNKEHF
jgi:hypothetical protein